MIRDDITQAVRAALRELGAEDTPFVVEHPPASAGADFATNAALAAAKALGKNPREVADALVEKLRAAQVPQVERIEAAGPGFINFSLAREAFAEAVARAREAGERWGAGSELSGKTVMVEHTQPNPFKPFHIGHLMSNALGESLARTLAAAGAKVVEVNYQGDVGLHVAKALWGLEHYDGKKLNVESVEDLGLAYAFGNTQYEEDEVAKGEIHTLNKRIYERDPELMPLYEKGRDASLRHFDELYAMLGSHFEHLFFESEVWERGKALVEEGLEKNVFEKSDGAVVYRGDESKGLHTRVFLTKDNLPTYEAKELGLAVAKTEYRPFDLSITTTASEQKDYFKVVFAALAELRPELAGKFLNVTHGMMRFAEGKMSSRKGNVITGESMLEDMREAVRARSGEREVSDKEAVERQVAVAAIKYQVLKQSAGKDIVFDKERALSLEGDSGPYLQYAHTRACSILKKAKEEGVAADTTAPTAEAGEPERLLAHFPEAVARAAREYEPHYVAQYLTELAGAFNSWYASTRVLDGTSEASYKLAVVDAVRLTLRKGLSLLGCEAPEEM